MGDGDELTLGQQLAIAGGCLFAVLTIACIIRACRSKGKAKTNVYESVLHAQTPSPATDTDDADNDGTSMVVLDDVNHPGFVMVSKQSKIVLNDTTDRFSCVIDQNGRRYNEDWASVSVRGEDDNSFVAIVCDGHSQTPPNGHEIASYVGHKFMASWEDDLHKMDHVYMAILFARIDADLKRDYLHSNTTSGPENERRRLAEQSGCTATAVYYNAAKREVVCGNVGDSRAALFQLVHETDTGRVQISTLFATTDHKPNLPRERERLAREKIEIRYDDTWRVGNLAISRSFGNWGTAGIIAEPEIFQTPTARSSSQIKVHCVLIVGSDGLWDAYPLAQLGTTIHAALEELYKNGQPHEGWGFRPDLPGVLTARLLEKAQSAGNDNIAIAVVVF